MNAMEERIANMEDRIAAVEGRTSSVEGRMGLIEQRQSRTESLLLQVQGEIRKGQREVLHKLDEVKELLSLGLGKTVVKAVTSVLIPVPPPAEDPFAEAVDRLDSDEGSDTPSGG